MPMIYQHLVALHRQPEVVHVFNFLQPKIEICTKMRVVLLALTCVGFDLIFVQASASDDINPGKLEFDNG